MEAIHLPRTAGATAPPITVTQRGRPVLRRLARASVMVADALTVAAAMAGGLLVLRWARGLGGVGVGSYVQVGALAIPAWVAVFERYHLYNARHVAQRRDELGALVHAVIVAVLGTAVVAFVLDSPVARPWLAMTFLLAVPALVLEREVARRAFDAARRRGHLLRPVAIAGVGTEAAALAAMLGAQPELGYRLVALVGDPDRVHPDLAGRWPVLEARSKVPQQVRMAGASGVLVATTDVDLETVNRLSRVLTDAGIHVELSSSLKDIDASRLSVRTLGRFSVLYVEPVLRAGWRAAAKRAFDVAVSFLLVVASAPLWVAIALAIKLTSRGPVLFRQERVGRRGRRFTVYKFRTMVVDAERRLLELRDANDADGPLFKLREDPRVTTVGRLLRRLSLDELPQLLNVLRGEMSLVGPRPALPAEVTQWGPELFERLRVQPGITGMWQVNGRSNASFAEYQRWDLYYVDNWSIWRDLGILAKTVPVVLSQKGAY